MAAANMAKRIHEAATEKSGKTMAPMTTRKAMKAKQATKRLRQRKLFRWSEIDRS